MDDIKRMIFKRCLKAEALVAASKKDLSSGTMTAIAAARAADALRTLIEDAGWLEEYRTFYYTLALRAAKELTDDRDR